MIRALSQFFLNDKAGGIVLIGATVLSITLANIFPQYIAFWDIYVVEHSIVHWINDGLMAIFFLLVGLELKREFLVGELANIKRAVTPLTAAVGGVVVPALLYYLINASDGNVRGAGIPMATDIVFALGVLSLVGNRAPVALKVFLTALAVIDDLCAILVIAVFYSQTISVINLSLAAGVFLFLMLLNRFKVQSLAIYLIFGIALWYFLLHSGIHASIAGVLLAVVIPFSKTSNDSPSHRLQHFLHLPVTFFILPLFAMANTAINLAGNAFNILDPISLGIIIGLLVGKPIGIFLFTFLTVKLNVGSIPSSISWRHIFGLGLLGGVGFTISIFISLLAFDAETIITQAKISILIASLLSGVLGYVYLARIMKADR